MNLKIKTATLIASTAVATISLTSLNGQTVEQKQTRSRVEGTERAIVPENLGKPGDQSNGDTGGAAASDAGAQRPIRLKKNGISPFFGYSSKYFYRSNPLMAKGKLSQQATAMWMNNFYLGSGLGVIQTDSTVITPYAGVSWTINDYMEGGLDQFNYDSTGAYAMLLAQYGNGWSARIGVNIAADSSTELDTEDYSEIYPNIGVMKAYSLSGSLLGIFDASFGKHDSKSYNFIDQKDDGSMDNWEVAASYGMNWNKLSKLSVLPKYRLSYRSYDKSLNDGRKDLTHDLSLRFSYKLAKAVTLDLSTRYTNRSSSGVDTDYGYKNSDGGGGLSISARF
jgi:hypothetical protein